MWRYNEHQKNKAALSPEVACIHFLCFFIVINQKSIIESIIRRRNFDSAQTFDSEETDCTLLSQYLEIYIIFKMWTLNRSGSIEKKCFILFIFFCFFGLLFTIMYASSTLFSKNEKSVLLAYIIVKSRPKKQKNKKK